MPNPRQLLPGLTLLLPLAVAPPAAAAPDPHVRVLQMNLCNSGHAACWADKPKAPNQDPAKETINQAVIKINDLATKPHAITLNEICSDDLNGLKERIGFQGDSFFQVYKGDKPYECGGGRNGGGIYGSAILTREPLRKPYSTYRFEKLFAAQYTGSDEQRVMGCRKMPWGTVCTAHTNQLKKGAEYIHRLKVTGEQCVELMTEAVAFADGAPLIVAGDLNLEWNALAEQEKLRECAVGHTRRSDGGKQHVITTKTFVETGVSDMSDWTDHPTFWAKLK
ncbi:hypothetical protein [Nonomuraea endophytica]|uniref:Endonuclease/exonuclease/phosphatase family protein n=1 Tax=Nonomuraea endophytica TaxID=714136 RepID=A0A7W8ELX7_9ACTN|nr:hypothetical protein [Nonomuraea endophytica]MBB5083858.1 hypothetical protein [Nonomuraea endophytica]